MKKRWMCGWLMLMLMCLLLVTGCRTDEEPPAEPPLTLIADAQSDYVIVRADQASRREIDAALLLRDGIKEATGAELKIRNELDGEAQHEILVGQTNRSVSREVFSALRNEDYTLSVQGDDLVICGGTPDQTYAAVERFLKELVKPGDSLSLSGSFCLTEAKNYEVDRILLDGSDLKDYSIVYAKKALYGERNEAYVLRDKILERTGYRLKVVDDSAAPVEKEIVVGVTSRTYPAAYTAELAECDDNEGLVWFDGAKVYLGGREVYAIRSAVRSFADGSVGGAPDAQKCLTVEPRNRRVPQTCSEYSAMSFNIFCEVQAGDERIERVANVILREMPDTVGLQECTEVWYAALTERLGGFYDVVGEINDTNWQRWRNPVFYRKDRFRLVETSTQWLSPTPGTMSKLSATKQYRILTTAVLEDLQTGERITHCNTHMSYEEAARSQQFSILLQLVAKFPGAVVLTGDFNVDASMPYYTQIQNGGYRSAFDMTRHQDPAPTFPSSRSVIDFCFIREDTVNVLTHNVLDEDNQNMELSDHTPVIITYTVFPHQN